jgi:N-methylhydantoinase A/acetophenone carboxylase
MSEAYTIDVDVGGTFTDGFFTDGHRWRSAKVLTTPHDLTECVLHCVKAGAEAYGLDESAFLRSAGVARISTPSAPTSSCSAAAPGSA